MPGLASIAMVEAEVERDGRITRSHRFYLASAHLTPERFAAAVRAHWGIENGVHWVLDTVFDEDRARQPQGPRRRKPRPHPQTRPHALKRARPDISIRRKGKRSGWSDAFTIHPASLVCDNCFKVARWYSP